MAPLGRRKKGKRRSWEFLQVPVRWWNEPRSCVWVLRSTHCHLVTWRHFCNTSKARSWSERHINLLNIQSCLKTTKQTPSCVTSLFPITCLDARFHFSNLTWAVLNATKFNGNRFLLNKCFKASLPVKSWKHQIWVERSGGCNLPRIKKKKKSYFHHVFHRLSFCGEKNVILERHMKTRGNFCRWGFGWDQNLKTASDWSLRRWQTLILDQDTK